MSKLTSKEQLKQSLYRDARFMGSYDGIWKNVGKCAFCDLREKYVFFEENNVVMTVSLYAYIDGHFMIIPRRHITSTKELTQLEWETIRKFSYIAKKLFRDIHGVKGMQLVMKDGVDAQSTVEHLHFHCIPFDSPDLCKWNYRKLKYTPIENRDIFGKNKSKIIKYAARFDTKYLYHTSLPIVCDLIMVDKSKKILFQERTADSRLENDLITLPGGRVESFKTNLINELAREVKEEIGYNINIDHVKLLSSQIGDITYFKKSVHLRTKYQLKSKFLWNTYLLKDVDPNFKFKPADDCKNVIWLTVKQIQNHKRISLAIKSLIEDLVL